MASKIYTAQEMRAAADTMDEYIKEMEDGNSMYWRDDHITSEDWKAMLRQTAEVVERCEKVIARCNEAKDMSRPAWSFDKQAFAMDLCEVVNHILRGDAGNDNENK